MQRVTVPYRQEPGMITPMPLLDIHLSHDDHSIQATALIDSGAMISLLPFEYGQQLGLTQADQRVDVQLGGILQGVKAFAIIVHAQVKPLPPMKLVFAWAEKTDRPVPLVLGQINFFKQFRVDFVGKDDHVFLSLA
jgi:hypothetical protein